MKKDNSKKKEKEITFKDLEVYDPSQTFITLKDLEKFAKKDQKPKK